MMETLILKVRITTAADDMIFVYFPAKIWIVICNRLHFDFCFVFQRKLGLAFHVNHLLLLISRKKIKINKIIINKCRLLQICLAL